MPAHDPKAPASAAAPPVDGAVAAPDAPQAPSVVGDDQAPVEPPQTPAQTPEADEVKAGTVREVLTWVNAAEGDERRVRAQATLDVENASSQPRKSLVAELEELLSDDATS